MFSSGRCDDHNQIHYFLALAPNRFQWQMFLFPLLSSIWPMPVCWHSNQFIQFKKISQSGDLLAPNLRLLREKNKIWRGFYLYYRQFHKSSWKFAPKFEEQDNEYSHYIMRASYSRSVLDHHWLSWWSAHHAKLPWWLLATNFDRWQDTEISKKYDPPKKILSFLHARFGFNSTLIMMIMATS
jgi:hypothetical protein